MLEPEWKFRPNERDDTRAKRLNEILNHLRALGIADVDELQAALDAVTAALALKAPLASPPLTGLPVVTNNDPTRGIMLTANNVGDTTGSLFHVMQDGGSWAFGFTPAVDRFSFYRGRSPSNNGTEVAFFDWATTSFNLVSGWEIRINNVQVVGPRSTGWGAMTGTATKTAIAAYAAPAISNPPTQAEVQALADALQAATRRLKAYDDAFVAHGLIGP